MVTHLVFIITCDFFFYCYLTSQEIMEGVHISMVITNTVTYSMSKEGIKLF